VRRLVARLVAPRGFPNGNLIPPRRVVACFVVGVQVGAQEQQGLQLGEHLYAPCPSDEVRAARVRALVPTDRGVQLPHVVGKRWGQIKA